MKENLKKPLGLIILFIITLVVLYLSLKDNFSSILNEIKNMNILWLLFAVGLFNLYIIFRTIVTVKLVHKFNKQYRFWTAFKMEYEIIFFNAITPFSTGGKPYEIYALKKQGLKVTEASNVAIQNFIVYQFALIILGLIALIYNKHFIIFKNVIILKQFVIAGFLINTLVIVILFLISFAKDSNKVIINFFVKILSKLKIFKNERKVKEKMALYLDEFYAGAVNLAKDKFKVINMICFHFISLLCLYIIPLIILYGMKDYISLNIFTSIITSAYVILIASVVPMPGGTGGIEYAFLIFYGNFITGSKLNALMLVWRFITFYLSIIIGSILLSKKNRVK